MSSSWKVVASLMSWSRVLFMIACAKKMDGEGVNRCNCDANDGTWRRDTGTLTDKRTIPVKEMRFGDSQGSQELALYRLGEFKCTGKGKGFSRVENRFAILTDAFHMYVYVCVCIRQTLFSCYCYIIYYFLG